MQGNVMNMVNDSENGYSVGCREALEDLLAEVLGSSAAGKRVMSKLVSASEDATSQSIKDRLRLALSSGQISGVTPNQARRLSAMWQLVGQLYFPEIPVGEIVDDPSVAAKAFQSEGWRHVEWFAVLPLDCKHRILSRIFVSSGTATETLAHPRDIFGAVMRSGGTRCIVAHNHPSGSLEPSKEDIGLTEQLLRGSETLGIPILDHLIISHGTYASIRQTTDLWTKY